MSSTPHQPTAATPLIPPEERTLPTPNGQVQDYVCTLLPGKGTLFDPIAAHLLSGLPFAMALRQPGQPRIHSRLHPRLPHRRGRNAPSLQERQADPSSGRRRRKRRETILRLGVRLSILHHCLPPVVALPFHLLCQFLGLRVWHREADSLPVLELHPSLLPQPRRAEPQLVGGDSAKQNVAPHLHDSLQQASLL